MQSFERMASAAEAISIPTSPVVPRAEAKKPVARKAVVESESNPVDSCASSSKHIEIYQEHQEHQDHQDHQEPQSVPQEQQPRRKRWKKPAIKKTRRFGYEISVNAVYYPSSDDDEESQNEDPPQQAAPFVFAAMLPTRQRKKRSFYEPEDVRKGKKTKGHTRSSKNHLLSVNDTSDMSLLNTDASQASSKRRKNAAVPATISVTIIPPKLSSSSKASNKVVPVPRKEQLKNKSFDQRLDDLKRFKINHGHCEVPYTYKPNQQLSNWCSNLRYSYGVLLRGLAPPIKMTSERIKVLKAVGFVFKSSNAGGKKKDEVEDDQQAYYKVTRSGRK